MRKLRYLLVVAFLAMVLSGYTAKPHNDDVLFQVSTIDALLAGVYDGNVTYQTLEKRGDLGIGTFNALDGEMIALGGEFYKIRADGKVYEVGVNEKAPFAAVTFFDPDQVIALNGELNLKQLEKYIDSMLPTENIFYAIKIEGTFKYIKTRSVPKQEKPYPPIAEIVKNQPVFEFHDVKGTLVGFRCPAFVRGVNVPGYHLHFINEDRTSGGHLLECKTGGVGIEIDHTRDFSMELSENEEFYGADLTKDKKALLHKVEKE